MGKNVSPRQPQGPASGDGTAQTSGQKVWALVQDALKDRLGEAEYSRWIADLRLAAEQDGTMLLAARDLVTFDRVSDQHLRLIEKLWSALDAASRPLKLICWRHATAELRELAGDPWSQQAGEMSAAGDSSEAGSEGGNGAGPGMTFDTLVTGPSNEIAATMARRIAAGLPTGTPTVLIYGPPGTGKTHLMHALRHESRRRDSGRHVVYLTAEEFMSAYIDGVKAKDTAELKKRLRAAALLLVDDLHRVAGLKGTEAELFQNLREVTGHGGQVVLVSDSAPGEASSFGERMRNEIKGATAIEIGLPDAGMRREIVERLAAHIAETHPAFVLTPEMVQRLNSGIRGPGRELTGAVWSLYTEAGFGEQAPTPDMLERIIRRHAGEQKEPSIELIKRATLKVFPIAKADLEGPSKSRSFVYPRQIAMYLCRTMTRKSYPQIARAFGRRDHTTVLYSFEKLRGNLETDTDLATDLERVQETIADLLDAGHS
ncbi:chromosomal replication initiator protein DnaA [Hyphomonas sp.]|uniref:chromosomal replication initiator protein DnaA n=1 Tax=Hyphomonas sp. TaxID=87 RepID=UPI00391D9143